MTKRSIIKNRVIAVLLAAVMTVTGISFTGVGAMQAQAAGDHDVYRVSGKNRYYTSLSIAEQSRQVLGVDQFETVILATGQNFADALSGSYLSYVKTAPIILIDDAAIHPGTPDNDIISYVRKYVKAGGTIYVLGGTGAVPNTVLEGLESSSKDFKIHRLSGKDRYATNLEILKEAGVESGSVIVATGENYADSLSAAATKKPILLVNKNLTQLQKDYIASKSFSHFNIIGGTAAVPTTIFDELDDWGATRKRISGTDRYATSVEIAKTLVKEADSAVLAYGGNYPDGLCGALLATATNSAIILSGDKYISSTEAYLDENGIQSGYVLGGSGVFKDDTISQMFDIDIKDIKKVEWK